MCKRINSIQCDKCGNMYCDCFVTDVPDNTGEQLELPTDTTDSTPLYWCNSVASHQTINEIIGRDLKSAQSEILRLNNENKLLQKKNKRLQNENRLLKNKINIITHSPSGNSSNVEINMLTHSPTDNLSNVVAEEKYSKGTLNSHPSKCSVPQDKLDKMVKSSIHQQPVILVDMGHKKSTKKPSQTRVNIYADSHGRDLARPVKDQPRDDHRKQLKNRGQFKLPKLRSTDLPADEFSRMEDEEDSYEEVSSVNDNGNQNEPTQDPLEIPEVVHKKMRRKKGHKYQPPQHRPRRRHRRRKKNSSPSTANIGSLPLATTEKQFGPIVMPILNGEEKNPRGNLRDIEASSQVVPTSVRSSYSPDRQSDSTKPSKRTVELGLSIIADLLDDDQVYGREEAQEWNGQNDFPSPRGDVFGLADYTLPITSVTHNVPNPFITSDPGECLELIRSLEDEEKKGNDMIKQPKSSFTPNMNMNMKSNHSNTNRFITPPDSFNQTSSRYVPNDMSKTSKKYYDHSQNEDKYNSPVIGSKITNIKVADIPLPIAGNSTHSYKHCKVEATERVSKRTNQTESSVCSPGQNFGSSNSCSSFTGNSSPKTPEVKCSITTPDDTKQNLTSKDHFNSNGNKSQNLGKSSQGKNSLITESRIKYTPVIPRGRVRVCDEQKLVRPFTTYSDVKVVSRVSTAHTSDKRNSESPYQESPEGCTGRSKVTSNWHQSIRTIRSISCDFSPVETPGSGGSAAGYETAVQFSSPGFKRERNGMPPTAPVPPRRLSLDSNTKVNSMSRRKPLPHIRTQLTNKYFSVHKMKM